MEQFLTPPQPTSLGVGERPTITELLKRNAALVIAHPGHELCVYGWLTLAKPTLFVLTDGSGRTGMSRLSSTARIMAEVGARKSTWFGRHTDQVVYEALLGHDTGFFCDLAEQLADALQTTGVEYVVGDSIEGYNPTHDVCRMLINTAVTLVNQRGEKQIQNFDFPIIGRSLPGESVTLKLDGPGFHRKMEVMRSYPELADEVSVGLDGAILKKLNHLGDFGREIKGLIQSRGGADFFREESFRPVSIDESTGLMPNLQIETAKPYYERYAEILVAAGHYQQVIRYVDHLYPVAEALHDLAINATVPTLECAASA